MPIAHDRAALLPRLRRLAAVAFAISAAGCSGTKAVGPAISSNPVVIAHRGSSYTAPEHTLAAYDLALAEGADYIEQDVHRTRDGVLVVIHDSTLDRTTRGPAGACTGAVSDKTLAEVKTCDAGAWFNAQYPLRANAAYVGLRVPTLSEVIDRYGSRTRYYIEIKDPQKYPGIEAALIKLLNDRGLGGPATGQPRVLIQSFDAPSLRRVRELDAGVVLIQLVGQLLSAKAPAALDSIRAYASGIGPHRSIVDRSFVETAHSKGLLVHPYTVDDPADMAALLAMGVDGMFTNRPSLLRGMIPVR